MWGISNVFVLVPVEQGQIYPPKAQNTSTANYQKLKTCDDLLCWYAVMFVIVYTGGSAWTGFS